MTLPTLAEKRPPSLGSAAPDRIRGQALRRALLVTLLAWMPGAFWQGATGNTALTPFGKYLGANDLILSMLLVGAPALSSLLQIPGAMMVQRLGARKQFFIWTVTPHRTLYLVIGLLPWVLPAGSRSTALVMSLLVFVSMGLNNFGGQAWVNWMADMVPPRIRGRYFARRTRMGVGVAALTMILVALILDWSERAAAAEWLTPVARALGHPDMPPLILLLSVVIMVAGAIGMLDILLFAKVPEPPMRAAPQVSLRDRLAGPLRDPTFRRYVAYWSVWTVASSWCSWLWMKYLLDFLEGERARSTAAGAPAWWGQHLFLMAALVQPVAFMLGQFLGYPMWGRAVDRFGRKPVFLVSSSLHTLSWIAWIFLSPALLPWMFGIQIAAGFVGGGMDIAQFNMMLQFNRKGGAGYQAVGTVVFSCCGALAAFAAGSLGTALQGFQVTLFAHSPWEHTFNRYAVLILVGVFLKYLGDCVFLARVHDLHAKPGSHALRFMVDTMYGTFTTLLFEPLRTGVSTTTRGLNATRTTLSNLRRRF